MGMLEHLVATYGYAAVFAGTFLEGETIVVVAGFLAHQGLLDPAGAALAAFLGSFLGDQLWFFLGRRHAANRLVRRVVERPLFGRVLAAIAEHPRKFILSFRFLYGLRTISPVALGLSPVPARLFAALNAVAAAVWAVAFTAAGYLFGKAVETVLGDIQAIEHKLLLALAAALAAFLAFRLARAVWRRRADPH
ncbi:MAG: VTT domain-containing protein [Hyphomicrobiales bacterium]|nr:VTT domain-containing protein [Hyphomicrobiales bacterium]MCP5371797.1 VTT domain-containing protein [Hyphomicrobiales bacterium]